MSNNDNKSCASTSINYYPGHMAKTKKQIIEDLKLIDVVIEVLDARVPMSSQNPDVREYCKNKKKIVILNKADLADDNITKMWIEHYKRQGELALKIEAKTGKGLQEVIKQIKVEGQEITQKYADKGRLGRSIKVMVLGIPNVGKSTFINGLAKRKVAKAENRPGVTTQKQWIKIDDEIEIMDTPGMLWPKLNDEGVAMHLAFIGTIGKTEINKQDITYYLLEYLCKNYSSRLEQRYEIKIKNDEEADTLENNIVNRTMNDIAIKRGAILSGGRINFEKVSSIIINDFQNGKLGKISIEEPNM